MDIEILTSYSFLVVSIGTMILAATAGTVGTLTILKGQSLIGDAIGHASYPGVVAAFMIGLQMDPLILIIGAAVSGLFAFFFIQFISKNTKLKLDAILAAILSMFFGLGMVLKSYIQGHPDYSHVPQGGLQNYIFGQAAFIRIIDVKLILLIAIPTILIFLLFYKEFKVFIFDELYAQSIGINTNIMYILLIIVILGIVVVGLKFVGAILISSFLIVPAISALQWSNRFPVVLSLAALTGVISAFFGTYLSSLYPGMSTGPSIILMMSGIAFFSMLFGPKGLIAVQFRKRRLKNAHDD